jgi:hypothetical protein
MRRWMLVLLLALAPGHAAADKDSAVEKGLQKAGKAIERGAKAAGHAVDRGAKAVQKGAEKVHKKVDEKVRPKP